MLMELPPTQAFTAGMDMQEMPPPLVFAAVMEMQEMQMVIPQPPGLLCRVDAVEGRRLRTRQPGSLARRREPHGGGGPAAAAAALRWQYFGAR